VNCNLIIRAGFTYRLYRLKPGTSRSKTASTKLVRIESIAGIRSVRQLFVQHHLKDYFRKQLKFIVIIQYMQLTKTILYNKFQQTLAKKQFLIEELLFGQIQINNSKINPRTPLVINTDHFCCCNMDECLK